MVLGTNEAKSARVHGPVIWRELKQAVVIGAGAGVEIEQGDTIDGAARRAAQRATDGVGRATGVVDHPQGVGVGRGQREHEPQARAREWDAQILRITGINGLVAVGRATASMP